MLRTAPIVGLGIDVVEIAVIEKARFKKRIAEYFLTKSEQQKVPLDARQSQYLASRFALKEAVIKAYPERLSPFDFRIEKNGRHPSVVFVDQKRSATYSVLASLTHTTHVAAATAIVISEIA